MHSGAKLWETLVSNSGRSDSFKSISSLFQLISAHSGPFKIIQNRFLQLRLQFLMIKTGVIINQGLTEGQTLGNRLDIEAASTHRTDRMMFSPNYCSRGTRTEYTVKVLVG